MIIGIFIVLLWMILVPFGIGLIVTSQMTDKSSVLLKSYLFGIVVYFAMFQVLIVSNMLSVNNFFQVCTIFAISMSALAVIGLLVAVKKGVFREIKGIDSSEDDKAKRVEKLVLWIVFFIILFFQLVAALLLTYPDGDDAYYVGVATYGADISKMYSRIPYTGARTTFDTRHCLAPFPYLIAFLSRMSGLKSVTIAHSILPVLFICFAYGIYYLIAKQLCKEKREIPLFMVVTSFLLMFGNYSVYSMETFLMTRTRQGKASLGSFALPLGFYLLMLLAKNMDKKKKDRVIIYVLLFANGLVAALFTTLGNFIYPCMIAIGGLCICFSKKDWKKLIPLAISCVPSIVMAILYFLIR